MRRCTHFAFYFLAFLAVYVTCDTIKVDISGKSYGDPVNSNFVGFSFEVSSALGMVGKSPAPPKASFVQLLKNLVFTPNSEGPRMRIGGNSADESWWDPDHTPNPPDVHYDITSTDLISLNAAAKLTNSTIVFDTNFRQANSPDWAVNHVKAIERYIGWDNVFGIEIGNECDLYSHNGIRSSNFTMADYEVQWEKYANALYATGMPKPRIQGATFCCDKTFNDQLPGYITKYRSLLRSVSFHRYPEDHCNGHEASLDVLLEDRSSSGQAEMVRSWAATAKSVGVEFWIGESNSVACGGQHLVSDVFGVVLWAVDYLLNLASVGVRGINFHGGPTGIYPPIIYDNSDPDIPTVRPLYYAMWVFASATRNHATFINATTTTSNQQIKVWVVANGDSYRVVIIHKDYKATSSAEVTITTPKALTGNAELYVLQAPQLLSEDGLSFAGQSFDNTRDGKPSGVLRPVVVSPSNDGYKFTVKPATVVVLELPTQ
eukprot:TRINITY_DN6133_c0_g2_i1.p1 TRINITY_DN6133_c0_g2~~TRINITY_DN6133_c0_g2_i1.p1  ORF type:complete len:488 (+),score=105.79 TRINITY_DN6133_c0_g2_i1:32-1495(+)